MSKVALVTGTTRGIGRAISLGLAKNGYNVVIAGKSTEDKPNLPGNIYSVADEVEKYNVKALPVKTDIQYEHNIINLMYNIKREFKRLDVVVNNAGALWWKPMMETPGTRYDLLNNINSRGAFLLSQYSIPLMLRNGGGHIIMQSPPLPQNIDDIKILKNKIAYMISKWGMTYTALGISQEFAEQGIAANTLWPMTPIESYALKNNKLGNEKSWRKADIMVDAVLEIIKEDPYKFTGNQLIDETYLKGKGVTDFSKYQCVPGYEPPKLTDLMI